MANREAYNTCMRPYITGSKPKEQRKLDFCVGAKVCSGKASSREQAEQICRLPKAGKAPKAKAKGKSCEKEALGITQCVMDYLEDNQTYEQILNVNSAGVAIANALTECLCQK